MPTTNFDVVILGGGSGGYACALRSAQLGKSVVLIEKNRLGGTCLHTGCIPTKALLHTAEVADTARDGASVGVISSVEGIDMAAVHTYKDGIVDRLYSGLSGLVKDGGITVVEGEGRLVAPHSVEVDGHVYVGSAVVLATGSIARTLGFEIGDRIVTSTEALAMRMVPERAVVVGGSVVGVEFASIWRSFGADVTIVEEQSSLVPVEDPFLSKQLNRAFRKRGITVKTGVAVASVDTTENGAVVSLSNGTSVEADIVLIAVGRRPNSDGMGFEEVGIRLDRGGVPTDERLRTNLDGVYAVGDLVPGLQLAHRGFAHGIFVAEEIAGLTPELVTDSAMPRVTYSEPEIASVGLTQSQAEQEYGTDGVDTVEYNLGGNGKSQILKSAGGIKIVRTKGGSILGVHMVGARIGEQIGEASLLVNLALVPEDLTRIVHAHPTQNEAIGETLLALAGKPLHRHR
ncbi:dihydrolipoyl dehydrogenase (plasmid) [Rhodococcus erythropolis]|uniref:dihydrolipoyl dehydrogenase n=1 Tax=Rhodococcus erythropolis TaxID=1833 RepID=UPI00406BCCE2